MAVFAPPPAFRPPPARPVRVGWPAVYRPAIVVPKAALVQPKAQLKFYPNLNASAAVPVDRGEVFNLHQFFDQYRISRPKSHGQLVANSKYIFVKMMSGEMLMHHSYRHPALAAGKPVLYAGEAYFNNGKLDWWSNGSGNYRPDAEHAEQAKLPMERFFSYQDILKGKHRNRMPSSTDEA